MLGNVDGKAMTLWEMNSHILNEVETPICITDYQAPYQIQYANTCFYQLLEREIQTLKDWFTPAQENQIATGYLKHTNLDLTVCISTTMVLKLLGRWQSDEIIMWTVVVESELYACQKLCEDLKQDYEMMLQLSGYRYSIYSIEEDLLILPKEFAQIYGLNHKMYGLPESMIASIFQDEDSILRYQQFYEDIKQGKAQGATVVQIHTANEKVEWFSLHYQSIYDKAGKAVRSIICHKNITLEREKEIRYQKWSNRFKQACDHALAYGEYDVSEGSPCELICPDIDKWVKTYPIYFEDQKMLRQFYRREHLLNGFFQGVHEYRAEHRCRREDDSLFWVQTSIQLVQDPYSDHIKSSVLIKDIDKEKQEQLTLKRLSSLDPLTGLYNRFEFMKQVEKLLTKSSDSQHVFLLMDIDCFKQINDTYGHVFGDQVLCDIAKVMNRVVRDGDLCGRLGGDEFITVLKDVPSLDHLHERLNALCKELTFEYPSLTTTVSIGVALYPDHGLNFQTLYEHGDQALYEAKRSGRNGYRIYQP